MDKGGCGWKSRLRRKEWYDLLSGVRRIWGIKNAVKAGKEITEQLVRTMKIIEKIESETEANEYFQILNYLRPYHYDATVYNLATPRDAYSEILQAFYWKPPEKRGNYNTLPISLHSHVRL